ncbi:MULTISPECIES: hypothetical protein [unclassified Streptosporangium]|uniref:hypothetical protein n=1 Tax=unclassified Streptosporangium TaxID=2632669 RepID=UPI002E2BD8CF|nr:MULTISPECIES: hypothetical protein [unclassified Streptosporangium]
MLQQHPHRDPPVQLDEAYGLDNPVGKRPAKTATFLERVIVDMIESADRWRPLLT